MTSHLPRLRPLWALLALAACPPTPPAGEAPPGAGAEVPPTWTAVRPVSDDVVLEAPARVLPGPGAAAVVAPPLRGTVTRVRVRAGDTVDAGAPLIDVLMPELLEAAGRLEGARVRLEAWTERHRQLAELRAEGLARTLDVSEAAATLAEARAELQAARAVLLSAGLREGDAAGLLAGSGSVPLRAPVGGVVTEVSAALGEAREPSGGALVHVSGGGAVRVEARLGRVAPDGAWALVTATGQVPLRLVGRAPAADPRDGTFLAWFEPEGAAAPPPGTLGRVQLAASGEARLFRVPAAALHRREGAPRVTTRRGEVPVAVAACEAKDCLVSGALGPDDEVQVGRAP